MNKLVTLIVLAFFFCTSITAQNIDFWSDVVENEVTKTGKRQIIPIKYKTIKLDVEGLKAYLETAPMENNAAESTVQLSFPMPDGTTQIFDVVESPIMEAGLMAQLPGIKTYIGKGVDDPTAKVRFDWTYKGFHAMIIANDNWTFIDPYHTQTTDEYITYYKKHFVSSKSFQCEFDNEIHGVQFEEKPVLNQNRNPESVGEQLRTYRLALACTGEYAQFHGGTVNLVASAMVTTMNRVNGVYENEVAIRLVLVANNNSLIFLNSSTDPFNNNNTGALITQGQTQITNIIGSNNFDIGHVFSTGAGGLAGLGVICRNNQKGRGVTGIGQPIGDPFDIDYVAHEIGHQFGGNHTFNGSSDNCAGNRAQNAAYEPGSGTTIMAYAGICAPQNIANNSDAYFHTHSFDEIITYSTQGSGNNCPVVTNTGNNAPIVSAGTGGFTIPKSTPFELVGTATDPDGDALTYCWEQHDLGAQGHPNSPQGNAPLFRSFAPVNTPSRIFPQIARVINNSQTMGEILPDYARTLEFRLTARDNQIAGGGVTYDVVSFNVTANAGPFLVTEPNTNQTIWTETSIGTVTWDIANTDISPVNCSEVDILLSTDGGYTYTYTLATNVPNTGSYNVFVPSGSATTQARVRVQASNNIFFDISNQNFTIQAPTTPDYLAFSTNNAEQTVCGGTDAEFSFFLISILNYNSDVNFTVDGLPAGVTANFNTNPAMPGDTVTVTFTGTENASTGLYPLTIQATSASSNQSLNFDLTILSSAPPVVDIIAPVNGGDGVGNYPLLTWAAPGGAAHTYEVRVATDPAFTNIVASAANLTSPSFIAQNLDDYSIYYWQVKAANQCAVGDWNTVSVFRTATSTCEIITGGQQKSIIAGLVFTYVSELNITQDVEITDINVVDATINHQRISDVSLALRSPQGTEIELLGQVCSNVSGASQWVLDFDDAAFNSNVNCNNNINTNIRPVDPLAVFNGESSQGIWRILISDNLTGSGGSFQTYGLEICYALPNANADPIVVNNDTLEVNIGKSKVITTPFLLSTDADNSAAELTYTLLMETSKGALKLNGVALSVGATFTQTDVDNGSLEYTHTGSTEEFDVFQFDVRDINGGWYGTPFFNIKTIENQGIATADNPLGIYPNPASTNVNVNFYLSTDQDVTIMIFDAIGKMVGSYQYSNAASGSHIFDLSVDNLTSGNYLIRVASEDFVRTEKVLIVK